MNEIKGGGTAGLSAFDYTEVDEDTAEFLQQKEENMKEIILDAGQRLGKELREAQEKLAGNNQYNGIFEKWYRSMGYRKTSVYNYINSFLLVQRLNDQTEIENFQNASKGLQYEIAKPSAESTPAKAQAKAEVLAGDIDKLKRYKERVSELERQTEEAKEARKQAEAQRDVAFRESDILRDTLESMDAVKPEVRTEYPDFFA
ncbi:hypothetical protein LCM23_17175 [Cytobacillus kochii]|uniref:hypothetical protein n=1 Tax=Cytobacillus kochii TaxID=859143 RepID=UPI001CD3CEC1|nr:hypothetical protein [Cytobacillus kochii]MCA1027829.1 hypothetical protein [Cytobacillus kochii]